jgi:hypothetical protein
MPSGIRPAVTGWVTLTLKSFERNLFCATGPSARRPAELLFHHNGITSVSAFSRVPKGRESRLGHVDARSYRVAALWPGRTTARIKAWRVTTHRHRWCRLVTGSPSTR